MQAIYYIPAAILCIGQVLAQSSISLSVAPTAPNGVSPTVDPTFPGFAFEERSYYYYAGMSTRRETLQCNLRDGKNIVEQKNETCP